MATPSFVNAGAVKQVTASTNTPVLPGSRVNGNLLVAWCRVIGTATAPTLTVTTGWTTAASLDQGTGNRPMLIVYAYVTGSEAAPQFTCSTGTTILNAQVLQYTGVVSSSPIGNTSSNSTDNTTTVTCPAITTTADNSLAVNLACANISTGLSTPSGWNLETNDSGTTGESWISDKAITTKGSSSGATSITAATTNYSNFIIEVRSQSPNVVYTISAAEGTYSLSGETVTLPIGRVISISQGIYSLTGETVSFPHGLELSATQGTYTLTGKTQTLTSSRTIPVTHGTYSLIGESISFSAAKELLASFGTYLITGKSTTSSFGRSIFPSQGTYTLTGYATLGKQLGLLAVAGLYNLLGYPAKLGLGKFRPPVPTGYETWSLWSRPQNGRRYRIKSGSTPIYGK